MRCNVEGRGRCGARCAGRMRRDVATVGKEARAVTEGRRSKNGSDGGPGKRAWSDRRMEEN